MRMPPVIANPSSSRSSFSANSAQAMRLAPVVVDPDRRLLVRSVMSSLRKKPPMLNVLDGSGTTQMLCPTQLRMRFSPSTCSASSYCR